MVGPGRHSAPEPAGQSVIHYHYPQPQGEMFADSDDEDDEKKS